MLSDMKLRGLKPAEKPYKVADRDGMYVAVLKSGVISFRYDYRLNGRRETLVIGQYGADGISGTFIEHLEWAECIRRYDRPHTLFYCDPSYWGTEGYGVDFPLEEYDRLAELARTIQGRMVITVNDIPAMRKAFAGLFTTTVDISYAVGGSARSRATRELVIRN